MKKRWFDFVRRNWLEKIIAVGLAVTLWFFHVHGSVLIYKKFTIPVEHAKLPPNLVVSEIHPPEVNVTFSGPRRAFYFLNREKVVLVLRTWDWTEGGRKIRLSGTDLTFPSKVVLENIQPSTVRVEIKEAPKTENA